MIPSWSLDSWKKYENNHEFRYPDQTKLPDILQNLRASPPLVHSSEIERLKLAIALAGRGQAFILQAGDCAESFHDFKSLHVTQQINLLLTMSGIISHGSSLPVVTIGRIAGQYAKPRTLADETRDGLTLPSYNGDLINQCSFNSASRQHNPDFLMSGYYYSKITHGLIDDCLSENNQSLYTSHEALHIPYEQSLSREVDGKWYLLSTHLPWIGMRTAFRLSAHVEFLRGMNNPIGVKVGPNISPEVLVQLVERLNPLAEDGRLLLITRMGADLLEDKLPALINAVKKCGIPVTWSCDPMHGNSIYTNKGIKTRHMDAIFCELQKSIFTHAQMSSVFAGAHFEITAQNVTECVGGKINIKEDELNNAYHSLLDPRLNKDQSIEIAEYLRHYLFNKEFL